AHAAEGKLQVELAQLEYNMARMRGLWTHLERLGAGRGVGGIGTRGPGESQIETDRRLARDRISALRRRLDHVRSTRAVMRAERERAHLPNVALAGYTNAGKSTLLNRLTGAQVGELLVPFSEGQTLSELHDVAGDLEREDTAEGVRVTVRLPAVVAERYDRYADGRNGSDGAA